MPVAGLRARNRNKALFYKFPVVGPSCTRACALESVMCVCVYSIVCVCVLKKSSNRLKAVTESIMHCFLRYAAAAEVLTNKTKGGNKSSKIKHER